MKRVLCLCIALCLLLSCTLGSISCAFSIFDFLPTEEPTEEGPNQEDDTDSPQSLREQQERTYEDRRTVAFSDMVYERPDYEALIAAFVQTGEIISLGTASYEEQLAALEALDAPCEKAMTMYSLAQIATDKNTKDTDAAQEWAYHTKNYPALVQACEDLYVLCANSPYAERLEEDWYGDGLIEEYKNGTSYTDAVVALLQTEGTYEADYNALSVDTVSFSYRGEVGTAEEHLARYARSYRYAQYAQEIEYYAENAYESQLETLLVNLIRTRIQISDALGYKNYIEYAYKEYGRDYSAASMDSLLAAIKEYVVPVYSDVDLQSAFYYRTSATASSKKVSADRLWETLYDLYKDKSEVLEGVLCYMYQYGLYDVAAASDDRFDGSYTTFLYAYDAPFVLLSTDGTNEDLLTLAHEFGHVCDDFQHDGGSGIDTGEVYSSLTELLTAFALSETASDYASLFYDEMQDWFEVMIYQGFYAKFEHLVYSLAADQVTVSAIENCISQAASYFSLSSSVNQIKYVNIPHIFLYPLYVESYCLSATVSMQSALSELDEAGAGWEDLENMLSEETTGASLSDLCRYLGNEDALQSATVLRKLANSIYYHTVGKYYFSTPKTTPNDL